MLLTDQCDGVCIEGVAPLFIRKEAGTLTSFAAVQRRLKELEKEREKVEAIKRDIIRRFYILCATCGVKSRLAEWVFIQDQYYVRPYSCTGGDYWNDAETQCCHIVCPKCNTEAYLYTHSQRDRIVGLIDSPEFTKKELFLKVKKSPE